MSRDLRLPLEASKSAETFATMLANARRLWLTIATSTTSGHAHAFLLRPFRDRQAAGPHLATLARAFERRLRVSWIFLLLWEFVAIRLASEKPMKNYPIMFEIAGPTAMWTRPDTGDAPTSYPAPTFSAVRGIFESVLWLKSAEVVPLKVEICAPVVYHAYTTNYGGPLRDPEQIRGGNNYQLIATVLINVCYRLFAEVRPSFVARPEKWAGVNGAHAYQEMFEERIARGQTWRTPCLGWQEFVPSYLGPFRPDTQVQESESQTLPSMLHRVFPRGPGDKGEYRQNVRIEKGVLRYAA